MRCLYCGKELALLKRWTRGGQFCSEAHQKSYQEEYNRIGLNRLLQAQNKPKAAQQEAAPVLNGGSKTPPRPAHEAPVAVEEAPVEAVELEAAVESVEETQSAEEIAEEAMEAVAEAVDEKAAEEPGEPVWEPESMAGFINDLSAEPVAIEASPYSQPWQPREISPITPSWEPGGVLSARLPEAAVLELKFRPNLVESEHSAPEVKLTPKEFEPGKPFTPTLATVTASYQLPSAGVMRLEMKPSVLKWSAVEPNVTALTFPPEEVEREWSLLQLRSTEIAFPGADASVFFEGESADGALWEAARDAPVAVAGESEIALEEVPAEETRVEAAEPIEEPIRATEDLAQLNEGLTEEQAETDAHVEPVMEARQAEEPVAEIPAREAEGENPLAAAESAETPTPAPRSADEAVEIPLKIFTPSKPNPVEGAGALIKLPVFLPEHTGLPLRPKMGLVPASGSGSKKSSRPAATQTQPAAASKTTEVKPEPKQSAESKPSAESKTATETAKPAATPTAKPWGTPTAPPASREAAGGPKKPAVTPKVQPGPSVKITPHAAKAREEEKPKQAAVAEKPVVEKAAVTDKVTPEKLSQEKRSLEKPAAEKSAPEKTAVEKPAEKAPAPKPSVEVQAAAAEIEAPSFGAAQSGNASFLSTLKGKLTIGGVAVALCLGAYFIFGGKSQAPAPSPAAAAEKAGPSIMVGAGGWVEGWAGDPTGALLGRKITIYRPSLKLSDYRIEFSGEIEHKGLGWVFRATDPENYYAMKLAYITPGLDPKIGLLKSIVVNGKETQVGKTPINMSVRLETQYSIRVDVRGSKFTTYVQGQQVDTWNDEQHKVGGVGFLNEREERGRVKSVSVSLLNGSKQ